MIKAMYSAVAGLSAHQTKLDVIGNNISNVNTYGFKSSRVTFNDVFYQTLQGSSDPTDVRGGTNALQVGYGSKVASIDVLHTNSSFAPTSRVLDMYINGEGFFKLQDADGNVSYTRMGNFDFDSDGNLTTTNGLYVQGLSHQLIDSSGNSVGNPLVGGNININNLISTNGKRIFFDNNGALKETSVADPENDATTAADFNRYLTLQDVNSINIGTNGVITAQVGGEITDHATNTPAPNRVVVLGKVAIANIPNPNALHAAGNSTYIALANTGAIKDVEPGDNSTGVVVSGGLEMSNVDLSKEFTDMITAQRGFQANSRIITLSDSLLEELVNLKR